MSKKVKNICKVAYRAAGSSSEFTELSFTPGTISLEQSMEEHKAGKRYPVDLSFNSHPNNISTYQSLINLPMELHITLTNGDNFIIGSSHIPVTMPKLSYPLGKTLAVGFKNQALTPVI